MALLKRCECIFARAIAGLRCSVFGWMTYRRNKKTMTMGEVRRVLLCGVFYYCFSCHHVIRSVLVNLLKVVHCKGDLLLCLWEESDERAAEVFPLFQLLKRC